jgi:hypothetical protein
MQTNGFERWLLPQRFSIALATGMVSGCGALFMRLAIHYFFLLTERMVFVPMRSGCPDFLFRDRLDVRIFFCTERAL